MSEVTKETLEILLKHWAQHNREHGEEFRKWAEKAKGLGEVGAYNAILAAAQQVDKTNEFLLQALGSLKGEES